MARAGFPIKFTIEVPGAGALSTALSRYASQIADFTRFYNEYLVPTWYSMMWKQYWSAGRATGERWAPLSAAYAAWKLKFYPGQPVGVLSGATRASLTSPFDKNAVLQVTSRSFVVGTRLNYPIYLQMGTRRMPARPPMRVNYTFMRSVGKLLQRYAYDVQKAELNAR